MADIIGKNYSDGYVWEFKVNNESGQATVGVKAIAIDDTLVDSEVSKESIKLITSGAVKTYVDTEVAKAGKVEIIVPEDDKLPTASEDTMGKIYLIPKTKSGSEKNIKTEWITYKTADNTYAWEQIGDTAVDISGLASISYVDEELAKKVDKVEGKGLSTNDFDNDAKNKLNGIASGATKVEESSTNGYIKINGNETKVVNPAYDTIVIKTSSDEESYSAEATDNQHTFAIEAGDKIKIEKSTIAGNPAIKISADYEVTPVEDATIDKKGVAKLPKYTADDGCIDLTSV